MNTHAGESLPLWMLEEHMPPTTSLFGDIEVDVCVVGGGIAGLTTAYLLQKEGKSVCILEDYEIGSGQSGRTTAHFTVALDDRYFELEKMHGEAGAKMAAQSHKASLNKVEAIVRGEHIDCELERVTGYLFAPEGRRDILDKELDAVHRAGLADVHLVNRAPLDSFDTGPCLRFPQQLQLHPIKYMQGLARRILAAGGQIYTKTRVVEFNVAFTGDANAAVKTASGRTVKAASIVVATNTPVNNRFAIHTKQAPYRTYVIGARIPRDSVTKALYWDTLDPYHYVRIESAAEHSAYDTLIIGGEDHKTGQNDDPESSYERLQAWAFKRFPMIEGILYKWSGQVMEPVDGLAFLGRNPGDTNVYVITGDSGNGMTHATIGAMLITDQIQGRPNEWESLYSPGRMKLRATGEFLKENANVAAQYADWLKGKGVDEIGAVEPGDGVIVTRGVEKIAVYKDLSGTVEMHSAVCPHLGGIVAWNRAEKSWDCPCHGSRFDCHGRVIEGPATRDLSILESNDEGDIIADAMIPASP